MFLHDNILISTHFLTNTRQLCHFRKKAWEIITSLNKIQKLFILSLLLEGEKTHKKCTKVQLLSCNPKKFCFLQVMLTTHLRVKSKLAMLQSAKREKGSNTGSKKSGLIGTWQVIIYKVNLGVYSLIRISAINFGEPF